MTPSPTFFFDLYGTLCTVWTDEDKTSLWRGAAAYYSLCGAKYTPRELQERYLALCASETRALCAASGLGEDEVEIELKSVFRRLFAEKDVDVSDREVLDAAAVFRALSYRRAPRLMKGAAATLSVLRKRGRRVYLLSNAQSCFTVPELRLLGLNESFDGIFLSSDFGCRKPSAAFFRAALDRVGAAPEDSVMVGNDPVADMLGASRCGMATRYLHSVQSPPRSAPLPEGCREITSLTDLLA